MARISGTIALAGAAVLAIVVFSASLPPASPFAAAAAADPGGNGKGNGGNNGNGGNSGEHDNNGKGNANGKASGDDNAGESEASDDNSNTHAATDRSGRDYIPDEVVVANLGNEARRDIGNLGFVVVDERPLQSLGLTVTRLRVPRQMTAPAARTVLAGRYPGILVDLNDVYRPQGQVSLPSPDYPAKLIGWGRPPQGCGRGLRIGLLDTAVDGDSPGLRGANIVQRSFLPASAPTASTEHGTVIAAILVGQRSAHGGGLLPGAELAAAGIFGADPDGAPMADVLALLRGLDWLIGLRAPVINMSFTGEANDVLALALRRAIAGHAIMVAAAGNGGPTAPPAFPADAPGVIGVTAVDGNSQPYAHANRGDYIAFAAPGVRIWTPGPSEPGSYHTGTSFAAPFVTAAVAALVPADGEADVDRVVDSLAATAIDLGPPGKDPIFGRGLLQAANPCSQATQ